MNPAPSLIIQKDDFYIQADRKMAVFYLLYFHD